MARTRGSYPHPVLDDSDDVASVFRLINPRMNSLTERMDLEFEVELTDEDLSSHLQAGTAELVVRWKCAETFGLGFLKPKLIQSLERSKRYLVSLPQDDLDGRVEFQLQILAATDIPFYCLGRQNRDYADATFRVREGSVLAVGGIITVQARKLYDPMQPPLEACFVFKDAPTLSSGIELDFGDSEHVVVWIASEAFQDFVALGGRPEFQVASVMMPALMGTLEYMKEVGENGLVEDTAWHLSLSQRIKDLRGEDKSVLEQAQAILEDPVGRAIKKETEDMDQDDQE